MTSGGAVSSVTVVVASVVVTSVVVATTSAVVTSVCEDAVVSVAGECLPQAAKSSVNAADKMRMRIAFMAESFPSKI